MTKLNVHPFHILITKATVILRSGTDLVSLYTDFPSPFPPSITTQPLSLTFDAPTDAGAEYVRKHFGLEPEIINGR